MQSENGDTSTNGSFCMNFYSSGGAVMACKRLRNHLFSCLVLCIIPGSLQHLTTASWK